jgi:hypothetical protein
MEHSNNPAWTRHLDGLGDELRRLCVACEVKLRDPGVIERVVRGDETVCGTKNPIGFHKLRVVLMATYSSLNKAIDRLGPNEVHAITAEIIQRLDERQAIGGSGPKPPAGHT